MVSPLVLMIIVYSIASRITRRIYAMVFRVLTVIIAVLAGLLLTAR